MAQGQGYRRPEVPGESPRLHIRQEASIVDQPFTLHIQSLRHYSVQPRKSTSQPRVLRYWPSPRPGQWTWPFRTNISSCLVSPLLIGLHNLTRGKDRTTPYQHQGYLAQWSPTEFPKFSTYHTKGIILPVSVDLKLEGSLHHMIIFAFEEA
ncbi:hypothetical protein BGZ60DRAFT_528813 [Tricladium varicosporioides]|nr:hypothetical protein BGZ60DRAFT_528813 [Hymenoscyphus varicosporioides]